MQKNVEDLCVQLKDIPLSDYSNILSLAKKISKCVLDDFDIKIAVIGTCSIQMIVMVLRALLLCEGVRPNIYEGEYNGLLSETYNTDSKFYEFKPDIIVLIPDYRDIKALPMLFEKGDSIKKDVCEAANYYINIVKKIHSILQDVQILMTNIILPYETPLGNLEGNCLFSQRSFYLSLNQKLVEERPLYVTIVDIEGLASYIGKKDWFDESSFYLTKSAFSLKYIGWFCDAVKRQIIALRGKIRKCLVLDLDNVLWGGAVGDCGTDGILLDPNDAEGEAYICFQEYILKLKSRGVILAVCSKNDANNAKSPFLNHPFMKLRFNDISCFIANWDDKASNLKKISEMLNIGTDSLVFFDDNPAERDLIKRFLPEVFVIDVPEDPAFYIRALDRASAFDWFQITEEDINRTKTYADDVMRQKLMLNFDDYDSYLRDLDMKASFKRVNAETVSRYVQLMNKTNQFNLMTNRYSKAEILNLIDYDTYELYTVSLSDKFSEYGIIACIMLKFENVRCIIDGWCMSCRVLKRGVENYTISKIKEVALKRNCKQIVGCYRATKKNAMVSTLYQELGFNREKISGEVERFIICQEEYGRITVEHYIEEE